MVPALRKAFNNAFTPEKYEAFLQALHQVHPGAIEFRLAETPVFVPLSFKRQITDACEHIIDFITDPAFKTLTDRAIPPHEKVPGENDHCHCIAFDFAVSTNGDEQPEPKLIEMQGFPSLFGFQALYPDLFRQYFNIPATYSHYLGDLDAGSYLQELRQLILGPHRPENVILLEIKPHEQKTRIDFYCTRDYLGIEPVCITELICEGKKLFYLRNGVKTAVHRIYNRMIFDDLRSQERGPDSIPDITRELDVEWVPHPNWFYRISKFTMPFIRHPYIPPTFFLNEVHQLPSNLEDYVLKPLFSFAGQGVIIDVQQSDLDSIQDPENWILQRKVKYADIIPTPDIPAKVEIRMMYIWKDGEARPRPVTNLARLSKGKMIGVRYNQDREWVGGSVCYFEK